MSSIRLPIVLLVGCWVSSLVTIASAAEVTRVLGARSIRDLDVSVSLAWQHDSERAAIQREYVDTSGVFLANDLKYQKTRDSLLLSAAVGLARDLSFGLSGSFVLADNRSLDFDRRGDCATQTCLETLLRDGFLPGVQGSRWGLDAEHNQPFEPPSNRVFSGPKRHGLEYVGLGLRWAAMNQQRDATKPTWIVGLEMRLSVASDQRFDPGRPTANRGVGLGYHQAILSTMFSRAFGATEPYMGMWIMQPILTSHSAFKDLGTGSYSSAQRRLGGAAGVERTLWGLPEKRARLTAEVGGRLEYRFEGLAQSELWEVLSGDSRCSATASYCRTGIDQTSTGQASPNPGVVRSPAYGLLGGDAGLSAHVGWLRARAMLGLLFQESHFLTDAGSGNSLYDIPGRRFSISEAYAWHLTVDVGATF